MAKKDIQEFRTEIAELRETLREAAASIKEKAAEVRELGAEIQKLAVTAKKIDPGPGSIAKADYKQLLKEIGKLQKLAESLSDET